MRKPSIDLKDPTPRNKPPRQPEDLPRGLVSPPQEVRDLLEQERARHAPATFAKAEERLLNEWTIGYYFDGLNHEVLYRPTPHGPDVVAVGMEEVLAFKKALPPEEQRKLKTFLGY
jgi:hypothetical protein